MSLFYIAMGQGIIGQGPKMIKKKITINDEKPYEREGPNFYVRTSQLPSCTFICGFNSVTNRGGAYHYPAGLFNKKVDKLDADDKVVLDALDSWILSLNPTEITFVGVPYRDRERDNANIYKWLTKHSISLEVNFVESQWAAITIRGSRKTGKVRFIAGDPNNQRLPEKPLPFDMRPLAAGTYDEHEPLVELFGKNTFGLATSSYDRPALRAYKDSPDEVYTTDSSDDSSEEESDSEEENSRGGNVSSQVGKSKGTTDPKEVTK